MKLVAGIVLLLVALGLLVWSISEFVPTCVQYGAVPDERTCSGRPGLGLLLAMLAVTLAGAGLRILSTDRAAP